MVIIYSPHISPRINYVLKQVFERFLRVPYSITDLAPVSTENYFVIRYAPDKGPCDLQVYPSGLLEETGISLDKPAISGNGRDTKIFPNASEHFGCDIFSAIFWMLSRYEEYQPFTPDQHQRFPAKAALAYQHQFILYPVVDHWVHELGKLIRQKIPGMVPEAKFTLINTIDVDNAFAYRGKGLVRQTGALFKHLFKGQWSTLRQRIAVLNGKRADPYDNYAYIREVAGKYGTKTIFFHLAGDLAPHDRNIDLGNSAYRQLIEQLKAWSIQGLHPSYRSNTDPELVAAEKQKLETVTGNAVTFSRQHFLRLRFPQTYRNLIQSGIEQDFSMGFADHIGFRAGTGRAFTFYDLEAEQETDLLVQPLCVMEGTLKDYMHLTAEEAIKQIGMITDVLKNLDSTYVAVWHNETLGDHGPWKGWRKVFESQFT